MSPMNDQSHFEVSLLEWSSTRESREQTLFHFWCHTRYRDTDMCGNETKGERDLYDRPLVGSLEPIPIL